MTAGEQSGGPPGREKAGGFPPQEPHTAATSPHPRPSTSQISGAGQRWRHGGARRESALRSTPLGPCGCIRDPDHDRHRCAGISPKMVDAAAEAARHLLAVDLVPVFDLPTLRAMWRSGYADLVDELGGGR
jgi:hypothetical protein